MKTTLNRIRAHHPCGIHQILGAELTGYLKLQKHLGKTTSDDEEFPLLTVLDSNGVVDTLWCFRAVTGFEKEMRLFAVFCARQVQHLMKDARSVNAVDVAEKFANGEATLEELSEARTAADAAAHAAAHAAAYAYAIADDVNADGVEDAAAARTAHGHVAADYTAHAATYPASHVAAYRAHVYAIDAIIYATHGAATYDAAAYDHVRKAQEAELRRILLTKTPH